MLGFAAWWPCFCETLPSRCNMSVQRGAVHRVWTTIGIANGSSKTTGRCTVTDRQLACGWKLKRGTKTASLKRYADGRPQSREMVQTHQRHVCVFCRSLHGPFVSEMSKKSKRTDSHSHSRFTGRLLPSWLQHKRQQCLDQGGHRRHGTVQ